METILELVALIAVTSVACVLGYRAASRFSSRRNALLAFGYLILAWPVAVTLFPDRLYFLYPAFPYGEMLFATGFVFIGALFFFYGNVPRQRVLAAVLAVVLAYSVFAAPVHLAIEGETIRSLDLRVERGVTIQATFYTCVPSSLATILRLWGHEFREGEVAYALRTGYQGTSPARVPRVVNRLGQESGLQARIVSTSLEELTRFDVPVILVGKAGSIRHAVALIGLDANSVEIGDPLIGRVRVPRNELSRAFAWEGQAIIIAPDFQHRFEPDDVSPRAAALARSLAQLGHPPGRSGLLAFQKENRMPETGVFDWRTILALDARASSTRPSLARTLTTTHLQQAH